MATSANESLAHLPVRHGKRFPAEMFRAETLGCLLAQAFRNIEISAVVVERFWHVLMHERMLGDTELQIWKQTGRTEAPIRCYLSDISLRRAYRPAHVVNMPEWPAREQP